MDRDLREEIEWLEHKAETLQSYIEELEYENYKLKQLIGNTINTLETQNSDARKMIYGTTTGAITSDENFKSYYQKKDTNDEDDNSSG